MRLSPAIGRRAFAELLGTALLVAAVVGSGIAASRLSPHDVGLQLLENSVITAGALVALILALQPVSAAFNPVVTLVERALGVVTSGDAAVLVVAQVTGGIGGCVLANLMFGLPAVNVSTHHRSGSGLWLGEVVATFGLLLVIFGVVRSGRAAHVAYAVAGYILAAYWFTSSTSFANPAVTVARMFSDSFAGIAPASVAMFVLMQLLGGLLGYGAIRVLYPDLTVPRPSSRPDLEGPAMTDKPSVLFLCLHNAGRSQMSAGFARALAGDRLEIRSAGSEPAERVNPAAVEAMAEVGIDISAQVPQKLTYEMVDASDVVITMGCGDTCPVLPGTTYLDWDLPDPAGKGIEAVRPIRDEIRGRVQALVIELLPGQFADAQ